MNGLKIMNSALLVCLGVGVAAGLKTCSDEKKQAVDYTTKNYKMGYDLFIENNNAKMYGFDVNHDGSIDEALLFNGNIWQGLTGHTAGLTQMDTAEWKHLKSRNLVDSLAYFNNENSRPMTDSEEKLLNSVYDLRNGDYVRQKDY